MLLAAGGQRGEKRRELTVSGLQDSDAARREELAQLAQVRPVGLQRVARQAPLELEVGQEIECQARVLQVGISGWRHS